MKLVKLEVFIQVFVVYDSFCLSYQVRFWDHARSPQLLALYRRLLLNGDESGLVAYYRFDEPYFRKDIVDRTGANHGVLRGSRDTISGPF